MNSYSDEWSCVKCGNRSGKNRGIWKKVCCRSWKAQSSIETSS